MIVKCLKCGQEREGLEKSPMPTDIGGTVHQNVCQACWLEWMGVSTKVINENRLQLFRPEHRTILEQQMKLFLNLPN